MCEMISFYQALSFNRLESLLAGRSMVEAQYGAFSVFSRYVFGNVEISVSKRVYSCAAVWEVPTLDACPGVMQATLGERHHVALFIIRYACKGFPNCVRSGTECV